MLFERLKLIGRKSIREFSLKKILKNHENTDDFH